MDQQALRMFQQRVSVGFLRYDWKYWAPLEIAAQLFEEGGEVAREAHFLFGAKKRRPGEKKGDLEEEIGDVLFALACFGNAYRYDLGCAFEQGVRECDEEYVTNLPLSIIAELGSRVGRCMDEINLAYVGKHPGDVDFDESMQQSIGNVLRILGRLIECTGCTLEEAMRKNLTKVFIGDRDRFSE